MAQKHHMELLAEAYDEVGKTPTERPSIANVPVIEPELTLKLSGQDAEHLIDIIQGQYADPDDVTPQDDMLLKKLHAIFDGSAT